MKNQFTISISDIIVRNKKEAEDNLALLWQTMHPAKMTLAQLKDTIKAGHPFLCCKEKKYWDGQRLFCIDIDHFETACGIYSFDQFIALLDALYLPPCMAYTTFSNPDRKRERFRLLFQFDESVKDITDAKKISGFLYHIIEELIPGAADRNCLSPYHLFYPGKKIVLCRPAKIARLNIIIETIKEAENLHLIFKTRWVWEKLKQILEKDPFIPSATFMDPPAGLLIILGTEPWSIKYHIDIKTSLETINLGLLKNNRISYNLVCLVKIIDKYYNIQRAVEQSKRKMGTRSMTVFEHYQGLLSHVLSGLALRINCDKVTAKDLFSLYEKDVYVGMGIQVRKNTKMLLPVKYAQYAKEILNLSPYPNLFRLFQRDERKQYVLASIILLIRDMASALQYPPRMSEQYVVTYQMISDKLQKKFHVSVSTDCLAAWLKQFDALQLIHLCKKEELASTIKRHSPLKNLTVIQIPYFDKTIFAHAEILASRYKPPVKITRAEDWNYETTKAILSALLQSHGWFSRTSFIQCIRDESALNNTNGYTVKNAMTYFDKHILQIQQELHLIKSSCTKELMARFPGNHKIGLTKLYYRGDNKCQKS